MHLACHLREIRGKRPIREVEAESGVSRAYLSQIERGRMLPTEDQIPELERAYGVMLHEMYPAFVLAAVNRDDEAA